MAFHMPTRCDDSYSCLQHPAANWASTKRYVRRHCCCDGKEPGATTEVKTLCPYRNRPSIFWGSSCQDRCNTGCLAAPSAVKTTAPANVAYWWQLVPMMPGRNEHDSWLLF